MRAVKCGLDGSGRRYKLTAYDFCCLVLRSVVSNLISPVADSSYSIDGEWAQDVCEWMRNAEKRLDRREEIGLHADQHSSNDPGEVEKLSKLYARLVECAEDRELLERLRQYETQSDSTATSELRYRALRALLSSTGVGLLPTAEIPYGQLVAELDFQRFAVIARREQVPHKLMFEFAKRCYLPHSLIDEELLFLMSACRANPGPDCAPPAEIDAPFLALRLASRRGVSYGGQACALARSQLQLLAKVYEKVDEKLKPLVKWQANAWFADFESRLFHGSTPSEMDLSVARSAYEVLDAVQRTMCSPEEGIVKSGRPLMLPHTNPEVNALLAKQQASLRLRRSQNAVLQDRISPFVVSWYPGDYMKFILVEKQVLRLQLAARIPLHDPRFFKNLEDTFWTIPGFIKADEASSDPPPHVRQAVYDYIRFVWQLNTQVEHSSYRTYLQASFIAGLRLLMGTPECLKFTRAALRWLDGCSGAFRRNEVWRKDLLGALIKHFPTNFPSVRFLECFHRCWETVFGVRHWLPEARELAKRWERDPGLRREFMLRMELQNSPMDRVSCLLVLEKLEDLLMREPKIFSYESSNRIAEILMEGLKAPSGAHAESISILTGMIPELGEGQAEKTQPGATERPSAIKFGLRYTFDDRPNFREPVLARSDYVLLCDDDSEDGTVLCSSLAKVPREVAQRLQSAFKRSRAGATSRELEEKHRDMVFEALSSPCLMGEQAPEEFTLERIFESFLSKSEIQSLIEDLNRLSAVVPPIPPYTTRIAGAIKRIDINSIIRDALDKPYDPEGARFASKLPEPTRTHFQVLRRLRLQARSRVILERSDPTLEDEAAERRWLLDTYLCSLEISRAQVWMQGLLRGHPVLHEANLFLHLVNQAVTKPCSFLNSIAQELRQHLEDGYETACLLTEVRKDGPLEEALRIHLHAVCLDEEIGKRLRECGLLGKPHEPEEAPLDRLLKSWHSYGLGKCTETYEKVSYRQFLEMPQERLVEQLAKNSSITSESRSATFHSSIGKLLFRECRLQEEGEMLKVFTWISKTLLDELDDRYRDMASGVLKMMAVSREAPAPSAGRVAYGQIFAWTYGLSVLRHSKPDLQSYISNVAHELLKKRKPMWIRMNLTPERAHAAVRRYYDRYCNAQDIQLETPRLLESHKQRDGMKDVALPQAVLKAAKKFELPKAVIEVLAQERRTFAPFLEHSAEPVHKLLNFFCSGARGREKVEEDAQWYEEHIRYLIKMRSMIESLPPQVRTHGKWLWTALFFDMEDLKAHGIAGLRVEEIATRYFAAFQHACAGRALLNPRSHRHSIQIVDEFINKEYKDQKLTSKNAVFRPHMLLGLEDVRMDAYTGWPILSSEEKRWIRAEAAAVKNYQEYLSCVSTFLTSRLKPDKKYAPGDDEAERLVAYKLTQFLCDMNFYLEDVDWKFYNQALVVSGLRGAVSPEERLIVLDEAAAWLEEHQSRDGTSKRELWEHSLGKRLPDLKIRQDAFRNCPSPLLENSTEAAETEAAPWPSPHMTKSTASSFATASTDGMLSHKSSAKKNTRKISACSSVKVSNGPGRSSGKADKLASVTEPAIHSLYEWDALFDLEVLLRNQTHVDSSGQKKSPESTLIDLCSSYRRQEVLQKPFWSWLMEDSAFIESSTCAAGTAEVILPKRDEEAEEDVLSNFIERCEAAEKDMPKQMKKRAQKLVELRKIFRGNDEGGRRRYPFKGCSFETSTIQGKCRGVGDATMQDEGDSAAADTRDKYLESLPTKLISYCQKIWPRASTGLATFIKKHIETLKDVADADAKHQRLLMLEMILGQATMGLTAPVRSTSAVDRVTSKCCKDTTTFYRATGNPWPYIRRRLRASYIRLKLDVPYLPPSEYDEAP